MGRKLEGCATFKGAAATPSNTTSPRPRFTSVPSGTLIHPAVWSVEPAALHAAAKNIIYFTALAVLRGAPAFCVALRRQSTDSVR